MKLNTDECYFLISKYGNADVWNKVVFKFDLLTYDVQQFGVKSLKINISLNLSTKADK